MNNHRPLSRRKTIQVLIALTLLAWATQTLFRQLAHGQEVQPFVVTPDLADDPNQHSSQKFISSDAMGPSGTLELRGEATIGNGDVKLKQICRWADSDAPTFTSIAEMVVARVSDKTPFRSISVDQIRQTLHDAGVNIAMINFAGATSCIVTRSDVHVDEHTALENWIGSQDANAGVPTTRPAIVETPTAVSTAAAPATNPSAQADDNEQKPRTLRELLNAELCQRLEIAPDMMQVAFNPEDEKVLSLSEPIFKFSIDPSRVRNLGMAVWDVKISTDGSSRKVSISARARAWENQLIVAKPLAFKEVLQDEDFTDRRILVDELPSEPLITRAQCVGQQASRDLKPGMVMTSRMVDPVPLVRAGQLVTITLIQGSVQIRSVGRAMESGGFGQSIKVKNETTRDVFDVTLTGPQEGRLGGAGGGASVASAGN